MSSDRATAAPASQVVSADWPVPSELGTYVRRIEGYREAGSAPRVQGMAATPLIPLILPLRATYTLHDCHGGGPTRRMSSAFLAGIQDRVTRIGFSDTFACIQIDLTPIGAWKLLHVDLCEIAGRIVDLRDVIGRPALELEQRAAQACDWPARFRAVEAFLWRAIGAAPAAPQLAVAALDAIAAADGHMRLGQLARDLGCSRQHLAALFRMTVGVSPKRLARIVRLTRAIRRLETGEITSLADLAAAAGYADQPHFTRECRRLTGRTPADYLASAR